MVITQFASYKMAQVGISGLELQVEAIQKITMDLRGLQGVPGVFFRAPGNPREALGVI